MNITINAGEERLNWTTKFEKAVMFVALAIYAYEKFGMKFILICSIPVLIVCIFFFLICSIITLPQSICCKYLQPEDEEFCGQRICVEYKEDTQKQIKLEP